MRKGSMIEKFADSSGQMTLELAVVFPVVIAIAVVAVNALQFFGLCASFDRIAHQEIRVYAASPSYGSDTESCRMQIEKSLQRTFAQDNNVWVSVTCKPEGVDLQEFEAKIDYSPTLFGLGLKNKVFGVSLPRLTHTTRFVVDSYRPGVFV